MNRDFNEWIKTLKENISNWNYYTDFNKVYKNVENIKVELNILNSLINSKNIENEFKELVNKYPNVLKAIPILLAKRENEIKILSKDVNRNYNFLKMNYTIDEYVEFMNKTGLFDLLSNHIISDLMDYVKGVEVGLDSNTRKNRSGSLMSSLVEEYFKNKGLVEEIDYFKELTTQKIKKQFGIDLSFDLDNNSKAPKRFDFVIKGNNKIYGIEVNYYSGGGSKLNETARSYKMLAQETQNIEGFEFIWITDGLGWLSAKNNLQETFKTHKHVYNLNDLENNILDEILDL